MKTIEICGREYEIECNALTYVKYKKFFNSGIMEDIQVVQDYLTKQIIATEQIKKDKLSEEQTLSLISMYMRQYVDDFIISVTRIAWILIYTANKDIDEYEKWLEEINEFNLTDEWIAEVTEFAVDCFC